MNNTKVEHTPGPWRVQPGPVTRIKATPNRRKEDTVATIAQRFNEDELDANARLIAAAPALLEALRLVDTEFGGVFSSAGASPTYRAIAAKVRAAIAAVEKGDA